MIHDFSRFAARKQALDVLDRAMGCVDSVIGAGNRPARVGVREEHPLLSTARGGQHFAVNARRRPRDRGTAEPLTGASIGLCSLEKGELL